MTLEELIQQTQFASPGHKAILNVFATDSWAEGEMASSLNPHGITSAQYNVLRVLRGRHPESYTCSQVADRLLDRTPDVTRLLVRLETAGLLTRQRADYDRRVVEVAITEAGLELLDALDAPVEQTMKRLTRHLTAPELETLSALLEKLRTDQE